LTSERWMAWMIDLMIPHRRPQDAVKMGVNEPQEEDFAMCSLAGQANLMRWAFSPNAGFYDRYMTLGELSPQELERWQSSYQYFIKKPTYKYGRSLVLKSPANTGRIKMLLELFPGAKFVHIHRHPYDVFRSHKHTMRTAGPWWQLQRMDYDDDESMNTQIIGQVKTLYESYFRQRPLIPDGRYCEVRFEDLER